MKQGDFHRFHDDTLQGRLKKLEHDMRALVGDCIFDGTMAFFDAVYVARFVVRHPVEAVRVYRKWRGR